VNVFVTKRDRFRKSHLEYARKAYERGELVLAGALESGDAAILVFRGSSPEAAEAFAKSDPYVVNGLVTSWRVRKWMTVIGEDSTLP
jgi:uncharacterized protein YciI